MAALQYDPDTAVAHLRDGDAALAAMIDQVGDFSIEPDETFGIYDSLARSIVFQQLATAAASTIYGRLCGLADGDRAPSAEHLLELDEAELRSVGISRNKAAALHDLALHDVRGEIPTVDEALQMTDDEVEARLTAVRGIGPWTVHMLQIFRLGRPDVLPVGDLGVRRGASVIDDQADALTPAALAARADVWRPYRSVASWYCWRAADAPS